MLLEDSFKFVEGSFKFVEGSSKFKAIGSREVKFCKGIELELTGGKPCNRLDLYSSFLITELMVSVPIGKNIGTFLFTVCKDFYIKVNIKLKLK